MGAVVGGDDQLALRGELEGLLVEPSGHDEVAAGPRLHDVRQARPVRDLGRDDELGAVEAGEVIPRPYLPLRVVNVEKSAVVA